MMLLRPRPRLRYLPQGRTSNPSQSWALSTRAAPIAAPKKRMQLPGGVWRFDRDPGAVPGRVW